MNLSILEEEFAKGQIFEATLVTDDGAHLLGICDHESGAITIDPKVAIVSTLLHELFHRRFPDWSERKVRMEENRAMAQLDQKAILKWYRKYKRAVRKRRPTDALEYTG